jgi:hypothetical protein
MEEVALAAEAILNNEAHHIPDTEQHGWKAAHIQDTLDGYPHPRSDLLPVFSANQVGATALMRVEVPTIERGTVEQAIADVPIVNEIL